MSTGYLGEIRIFGFNFAPHSMAFCNGQLLAVNQYSALFTLLGTTYGGNGSTTFGLPNLQSRVPVHFGTGTGLSPYTIGQVGGSEGVTLLTPQIPAHTHAFDGSTSTLNAIQAKGTTAQASAGSLLGRVNDATVPSTSTPELYVPAGTSGTNAALGGLNVAGTNAVAGGSQPHPNLQPYLALNFSIALQGRFPSRN